MFILVFSNPASSLLFILHIFPKLRLCAKVSPPRPLAQSRPSYWVPQWNASICWCVLTSSVKLVLRCMSYKQHAFLWLEKFFQIKSPLQELGSVSDLASRLLLKTIQNISKERSVCPHERASLHPDPNNRNSEEAASYFDKEPDSHNLPWLWKLKIELRKVKKARRKRLIDTK